MNSEDIVVSLENAKRLKEAGWPQDESIFRWKNRGSWEIALKRQSSNKAGTFIAAPTAEEILRMLPDWIFCKKNSMGGGGDWCIGDMQSHVCTPLAYKEMKKSMIESDTLSNAAAAMWCYLSNNQLLP